MVSDADAPARQARSADYPPPPWRLVGHGICQFRLVPVELARGLVPAGCSVVPVLPGRAIGAIYLATYEHGSTLQYNELIVVPALVRRGSWVGGWISHIYVDDERSMAGGREIWGLPKRLAQFDACSDAGSGMTVLQGERPLCTLRWLDRFPAVPVPVLAPAFGGREPHMLWFWGRGTARLAPVRARIEISADSPFAELARSRPVGALRFSRLNGLVPTPRAV